MIDAFFDMSVLSQVTVLIALLFLLVGSLVVGSFVLDVIVAAIMATSLVALEVKMCRHAMDPLPWFSVSSRWRSNLFHFYKNRDKKVSMLLTHKDRPVARWHGVFRWEILSNNEGEK